MIALGNLLVPALQALHVSILYHLRLKYHVKNCVSDLQSYQDKYMVNGDPNGLTTFQDPVCTHSSGAAPLGFSVLAQNRQRNYVTLCDLGLSQAGYPSVNLVSLEKTTVAEFTELAKQKGKSNQLDILAKKPRVATMMHELTHADSYFNSKYRHGKQWPTFIYRCIWVAD